MDSYFQSVFDWLTKCEKIFDSTWHGYGKKRIYAFLAERYISYWFQKNSNYIAWPIFFMTQIKIELNYETNIKSNFKK